MNILYTKVTNKYWFLLSLQSIKKYNQELDKIFILKSSIDLSDINDILIANQTFYLFCSRNDIGLKILVIDLNVCILNYIFPNYIHITYNIINGRYNHDHLKPQVIEPKRFLLLPNLLYLYPLSLYFKHIERLGIPDSSYTVYVNKPICCSIKSALSVNKYAIFNLKSYDSMKKYMLKKLLSLF